MKECGAVILVSLAAWALTGAGCAVNTSPLNSSQSTEQISREVTVHFRKGMPYAAVASECDRLHLDWVQAPERVQRNQIPDRVDICAFITPPGLYRTSWFAPASWDRLMLVVRTDRLDEASYERGGIDAGLKESRVSIELPGGAP